MLTKRDRYSAFKVAVCWDPETLADCIYSRVNSVHSSAQIYVGLVLTFKNTSSRGTSFISLFSSLPSLGFVLLCSSTLRVGA